MGVSIFTGLDWNTGLDYWTDIFGFYTFQGHILALHILRVYLFTGLDYWTDGFYTCCGWLGWLQAFREHAAHH